MLKSELILELSESLRPIERVEIFALEILYDGQLQFHSVGILGGAYHDGHLLDTGELGSTQTPLARDEFIFDKNTLSGTFDLLARHRERLEHAVLPNRLRERSKRCFVEGLSRLKRVGSDAVDLDPEY